MRPAELGADVCHMNLHKTFCIPHGGGGPGMGPIGVKAHLAPFLPGHPRRHGVNPAAGRDQATGQVSAAPWGSASILPISWAYIAMMGGRRPDPRHEVAILNANYIASRLAPHYPDRLYRARTAWSRTNASSICAGIKERTGITAEDVAKRLVDYGFHAPTMSWPVPETMMIEPTESEGQARARPLLRGDDRDPRGDRAIERGRGRPRGQPAEERAAHPSACCSPTGRGPIRGRRPSSRCARSRDDKYWPPVGRVDNVYGDRNLVCACPPLESYREAAE